MERRCDVSKAFLVGVISCCVFVNGLKHDTFWGEKAPKGCVPCPKNKEGLFDTPICGTNKVAYKNHCYLRLRNCIAKLLRKPLVKPSRKPALCGNILRDSENLDSYQSDNAESIHTGERLRQKHN